MNNECSSSTVNATDKSDRDTTKDKGKKSKSKPKSPRKDKLSEGKKSKSKNP